MKRIFYVFIAFFMLLTGCAKQTMSNDLGSLDDIDEIFIQNLNSEIGYCDVSEYYFKNYFSSIPTPSAYKISTSNDSSNFDEYGIFEFKTEGEAKKAAAMIKNYIIKAKKEFQSGIVYNVNEYPKFENATLKRYDRYIIYTILQPEKSNKIYNDIGKQKWGI